MTGSVTSDGVEMVMPGDNVSITVDLSLRLLWKTIRFAIREPDAPLVPAGSRHLD